MLYRAIAGPLAVAVLIASVVPSGENTAAIEVLVMPPRVVPWVSHSAMVPSLLALASVLPSGAKAICCAAKRWPANVSSGAVRC